MVGAGPDCAAAKEATAKVPASKANRKQFLTQTQTEKPWGLSPIDCASDLSIALAALSPAGTDREFNDNVNLPANLANRTVRRNPYGFSFGDMAGHPGIATCPAARMTLSSL
jgi:hypothetical protein